MKFNIIITLFLILFVRNSLVAQESSSYSAAKLNEDLDYFQKVIEKTHPVIYKYIEKAELDSAFVESRFDSTQLLSKIELEKRIRCILSKIACIHTSVVEPIRKAKKVFPITFYAEGKNICIIKDSDSLLDFNNPLKLVDINGNTSEDIISKMLEYKASDGYNTTFKYELINMPKWFNLMYSFYFDTDSIKKIKFVNHNKDTLQISRNLKAIVYDTTKIKAKYDSQFGKYVFIKYYDDNLTLLKIKSFSGGPIIGTIMNNIRYKKALKEIEQKKTTKLVIDLRDNTGGDAMSGYRLVSRFIKEKHRVDIQYHGGGIFKYAILGSKLKLVLNFFLGNLFSGRVPTFRENKSFINVKPKTRIYNGKLYVLVNGLTLSTASNVAAFFKYKTDAVLLGEETGGGENSLNAYLFPKIRLPNSKITIQIPQYRINLGLSKKLGSGVVPDIRIDHKIKYKGVNDGILNEAIYLISQEMHK